MRCIYGLFLFLILNSISLASMDFTKSICGLFDDRRPSFNPSVGRGLRPGDRNGCTITLIGKSCAISAGHCHERLENVEFNVPLSDSEGNIRPSDPSDVYPVNKSSIVFKYGGIGNDWSVFRLKKNSYSNIYPGERFGFFGISEDEPEIGDQVKLYSFGSDKTDGELERNYTQQVSDGPVLHVDTQFFNYSADSKGGSSGASVIDIKTDKIIGIHTHGWCDEEGGWNTATLIGANKKLKEAIRACLSWEKDNL